MLNEPGPASSVENHSLCKFLSSSDLGLKFAVGEAQIYFANFANFANFQAQIYFATMFDIEASKKCRRSRNLGKIYKFGKTVVDHPTSEWKGTNPNKLALWRLTDVAIYSYAILQINTATISSSAITLNLRRSNCDGWPWPRKRVRPPQRGNDERIIGQGEKMLNEHLIVFLINCFII